MSAVFRHLIKPFADHLKRDDATDIIINRPGEFAVEANGRWEWYEDERLTFDRLDALGMQAAFHAGRDFSPSFPIVEGALPDGERVHVIRPSATPPGVVCVAVRRPSSFRPDMATLSAKGMFAGHGKAVGAAEASTAIQAMAGDDKAQRLRGAVHEGKNIWIVGATGSGKTTLLGALIDEIPEHERIITIADTEELKRVRHRNRVSLLYQDEQGVGAVKAEDLVNATKRFRPDRVLMQELRKGAAYSFLTVATAGCRGCMATLHADSAMGAFDALRLMIRQHPDGRTMQDSDVLEMLNRRVDVVAHCEHDLARNTYRVTEIYERGVGVT